VLAYLARRLESRPVCLLLAWRPEDVEASHSLRRLLEEAKRAGLATVVSPGRLGPQAVAELARAARLPAQAERVHAETNGLPLFVVEYLAALGRGEEGSPPASVVELLRARAASVREIPRQVLAAASVLGSFDLDTVRDTSGRADEETVEALEELVRRALLAESPDGYRLSHEKLRDVVYGDTSLARRRLLHRRAAETLAAQSRRAPGPRAGIVAEHYRLAGRDADAAEYHRLAGEHARSLFANAEAVFHFQSALALGHSDEAGLHEAIGGLLTLQGEYRLALESLEAAAALAEDGAALARVEHKLGSVHQRRGEWEVAASRLEAAARAASHDPGLGARIEADRSLNEHRRGRRAEAVKLARRALRLAEEAGDPSSLAQAHNLLGILASSRGDLAEARRELERSLEAAGRLGDPGARVAALNNLALVARADSDLERAMELTRSALELCAAQGDRHREAALHNNFADLLHEAGRSEEAMFHLKQAVAVFAEIGADAGETQAEIWKLVDW
jgi:tetratricopeptide (TPR) repeat protein